jgi:xanthosine utilization system XapX-like protein
MDDRLMRILIVLIFLFASTTAFSQPKKGLFEGVGAFLGVVGAKQLNVTDPYALAASGLLGLFIGGQVGQHIDRTEEIHDIESKRCKKFITGTNRVGMACREFGQWVVVHME